MAKDKEAGKNKVDEMLDKLENGVKSLLSSEEYKKYLDTMGKFHKYSYNNCMLIHLQMPGASMIAGYRAWQDKFHRQVRKGERGITIFAPNPYKVKVKRVKCNERGIPIVGPDGKPVEEEVEVKKQSYRAVTVFDISQTDGDELPSVLQEAEGEVYGYDDFMKALIEFSPKPVFFDKIPDSPDSPLGLCNDEIIAVKNGMSQVQTAGTLVHEISHAILHRNGEKCAKVSELKEVEAESVAYTVCSHFGIDTSMWSLGYVATWGSYDMNEFKQSLSLIRETACQVIDGVEEILRRIAPQQ